MAKDILYSDNHCFNNIVLVRNFFRNINIHSYISLNDKNFISFHFIFLLMIMMLNLLVNYKR